MLHKLQVPNGMGCRHWRALRYFISVLQGPTGRYHDPCGMYHLSSVWWCGRKRDFITTTRMDLEVVLDGGDDDEIKGEEGPVYRLHVDVKGLKKNMFILSRK